MEGTLLTLTLICGLASWRLASLLHTEDLFEWLRKWIGIEHDESGYPFSYPTNLWGKIFDCFWCLSLVTSGLMTIVAVLAAQVYPAWIGFIWLGASAIAIWLEKQIMRTQSR